MKRVVSAFLCAASGCAIGDGTAFTTLSGGSIEARLEPGARDLGGQVWLTAGGARVTLERVEITVAEVRLEAVRGGAGFDPASPPPGYSLCHSGHCHSDGGALVSYEDIQAELAGEGGFEAVATAELDRPLLLPGIARIDLAAFEQDLTPTQLSRGMLSIAQLTVRASTGERTIAVDLRDLELITALDLKVDRDVAPRLSPEITVVVAGTLFDDFDLTSTASITIDALTDPGADTAIAAFMPTIRFIEKEIP